MYMLRDLLSWSVQREVVRGVWVAARPLDGPWIWRVKDAWKVLTGKADAFTWPDARPVTWCAASKEPRYHTPAAGLGLGVDLTAKASKH